MTKQEIDSLKLSIRILETAKASVVQRLKSFKGKVASFQTHKMSKPQPCTIINVVRDHQGDIKVVTQTQTGDILQLCPTEFVL